VSILDDVKQQLSTLGVRKKFLESDVVKALASRVREGEKIQEWCTGVIENIRPAAIFVSATDLNLYLIDLKTASATQLPMESIQKVQLKTGARSLISLTTSSQYIEIKAFDPKRLSAIAHFINSRIPNAEPLVDENPHAGKPFPKWRALFAVFIALCFYVIYGIDQDVHQSERQKEAAPTLSEDELNSCFISGKSAAVVYFSDVVKYSSNGLMSSTVMAQACEQKGASTINSKSCIKQCELGFRMVAEGVLK
jgi:hypothetical protein